MTVKQKIITGAFLLFGMTMGMAVLSPAVSAQSTNRCGGVDTSIISCPQTNPSGSTSIKDNAIWGVLLIALNILTAGVGIAAVGGIVYASILYTSAGDSTEQTKKAIEMIRNVVIGLVAYGLMYIVLNFLIPGGIFESA
ncbi:MAG TPA: hypothetical protein VFT59_00930 [Candidatus Saccharimonadales bacterium]|nr:hypothetical protein [Candidatus Saccharimonadales bacterium]